jgi:uncharacterized protein (TIGR03435 family)
MIMTRRIACFLALAMLSTPGAKAPAQQATAATVIEPKPSFEVVSIKPSRPDDQDRNWDSQGDIVSIENYTLRRLIRTAYGLKSDSQVLGGPDWIASRGFDIQAKFGDAEMAKMQKMSNRERYREARLALQTLLADRFQLGVRPETRSIPVYALVVAKTGAKLALSAPQVDEDGKPKADQNHSLHGGSGHLTAKAIAMTGFADWFTNLPECDRVVVDRTGLAGEYDFKLDWTEDSGQGVAPDAPLPGLFTALREQLGLELKPDKAPIDVVIVESASKPALE